MKIVIDAGHGGNDPGAIGVTGSKEKDIVLAIAIKLDAYLKKYGIETVLTRDKDFYLSLNERVDIANKVKADYFISIHCNSYINEQANGTEGFVYAKKGETYEFAKDVYGELLTATGLKARGIKEASFAVITRTAMPAVLLEVAFVSNPTEDALLVQENFQDKVAEHIAKGVGKYLGLRMEEQKPQKPQEPQKPQKPHWGKASIDKLVEKGLLTSPKDPDKAVTWAEFATVLLRAMDK